MWQLFIFQSNRVIPNITKILKSSKFIVWQEIKTNSNRFLGVIKTCIYQK